MNAPPNEKAGGPVCRRPPGNATKHPAKDTSAALVLRITDDTSTTCGRDSKHCPKCGETKPLTEFNRQKKTRDGLTYWCTECLREINQRYREANRGKIRERQRQRREADLEGARAYGREWMRRARVADPEKFRQADRQRYAAQPEKQLAASRRYLDRLHAEVFDHYGRSCACCGSTANPTIDHVNGDGKQHREELGPDTGRIYRWLIENGFPAGFQTLCGPCNSSKGTGSACRLDHSAAVTT